MLVKVSHITHVDNLFSIISEGCLWSDANRIQRQFNSENIGYSHIKQRRLQHPVTVSAGGTIGEYVPFNFCPRSVMLYVIHQGHDDYHGGQEQIDDFSRLNELDAKKIHAKYWQEFKEEKQAEFLAYNSVPWKCIRQIGVKTPELADRVSQLTATSDHKPEILVKPEWYY